MSSLDDHYKHSIFAYDSEFLAQALFRGEERTGTGNGVTE